MECGITHGADVGLSTQLLRCAVMPHSPVSSLPSTAGTVAGRAGTATVARVTDLTKRYGPTTAVAGISFAVEAGTITGVLGPNGAGKSTTLAMLLGLARPTSGQATISGRPFAQLAEPWRHAGAVLESNAFHPGRSGRNHLRVLARVCGEDDDRVDELLALVGLDPAAHQLVGRYSLGMRQRLGVAAALLGGPRLLVLDEPANGLDPTGVRWLRQMLRSFADAGGAVLVSSHLLAEAAHSVDRVLVIDQGRLLADASLAELTSDGTDLETAYMALVSPNPQAGAR